ncbi:ATP-dependent DNA helicase Q1-like [Haliotis cracherodii]|uniref:ATP-dependent DNA helicase Q1-like n=1 Tax=Haliotis cracherodii TaxID=6455 RepID=UPI0039E7CD0D
MNELRDTEFCSKEIKAVFIDECHIVEEWGKEFRKGYHSLKNLPAVFTNAMFIGLSGTLTVLQLARLPSVLGMVDPAIIQDVPDRPNIYLSKICKDSIYECGDVVGVFENIYVPEIDKLYANPDLYPVTLMFLPMKYMSEAVRYITKMFGKQTIHASRYSCLYSTQDKEITDVTLEELKKPDPRIRLILATSSAGMGFDPVNITRVIHCCPPRCISRYLQEIGRAGRRNQQAEALLYFDNNDIKANLPGIQLDIIEYCKTTSCMRTLLLNVFGFEKNDKSPKGCMCCVNCRFCCKCSSCCK